MQQPPQNHAKEPGISGSGRRLFPRIILAIAGVVVLAVGAMQINQSGLFGDVWSNSAPKTTSSTSVQNSYAPGNNLAAAAGAGGTPSAAGHAPNPSRTAPPSTAFAQFERLDAGRFHSTQQFTVFNAAAYPGAVDSIQYNYIYTDDRFAGARSYNTDVILQIVKFSSAEGARAFHDNVIARAIPIAEADRVRLPSCRGEKSGNDDFLGPSKIVRTLSNPRGGEITILHSGDFNMYDCTRGSNREETAIWTESEFLFLVSALPIAGRQGDTGYGRAQDLAVDYTNALGPR
jgi:hypothetical protein